MKMVVKCIESFRHQIKKEEKYLVIEILVTNNLISYRIIDEEGYPAIYDAGKFEIVSNHLSDYSISIMKNSLVISPQEIMNSDLNAKSIDGFWGIFIEDNQEAKAILKKIVIDLSKTENIQLASLSF